MYKNSKGVSSGEKKLENKNSVTRKKYFCRKRNRIHNHFDFVEQLYPCNFEEGYTWLLCSEVQLGRNVLVPCCTKATHDFSGTLLWRGDLLWNSMLPAPRRHVWEAQETGKSCHTCMPAALCLDQATWLWISESLKAAADVFFLPM